MSNYKITVLTITVSLVVFRHTQSRAIEDLTIDQYLGTWYSVGAIYENRFKFTYGPSRIIPCEWRDVKKHEDGRYEEVYTFVLHGRPERSPGNVTLVNSDMCIVYPDGPHLYRIKTYNNGEDLIFLDKTNPMSSVLASRYTTASSEAINDFETLAANLGGYVYYIENRNCFGVDDEIIDAK